MAHSVRSRLSSPVKPPAVIQSTLSILLRARYGSCLHESRLREECAMHEPAARRPDPQLPGSVCYPTRSIATAAVSSAAVMAAT